MIALVREAALRVKYLEGEINRLKLLIKSAEWDSESGHWEESVCPWCREFGFRSRDGDHGKHLPSCEAFTQDGEVT